MSGKRYWGTSNQYGPYTPQEDGWPNAGEVIRDYRTRVKRMSAATLAKLYGEAIGEHIGERWIQRMEQENMVPKDIAKRRTLFTLVGVPLILGGLGELSELQPKKPEPTHTVSATKNIDIADYAQTLDMYWTIDRTSAAPLKRVEEKITSIRAQAALVTGKNQSQLLEILCGYYTLASTVCADQCEYDKAYTYADNAVTLANNLNNNKLRAVALYQRGFVRQEQAVFSHDVNNGFFQEAISDFNAAIPISTPKVEAHLHLDLALVYAYMRRNNAADTNLKQAESIVERGKLNEGTFIDHFADIDFGRYRLGQAVVLRTMKQFDDASDALYEAKEKLNPAQTRRLAWADIIEAQIFYGQGKYPLAAQTALRALKVCKAIGSQFNIHLIDTLHSQLTRTNYGNTQVIRELGAELILP